jgi:hypothetical protein
MLPVKSILFYNVACTIKNVSNMGVADRRTGVGWPRCASRRVPRSARAQTQRGTSAHRARLRHLQLPQRRGTVSHLRHHCYIKRSCIRQIYIHTYHSRSIPEGVAEASQILLCDPRFIMTNTADVTGGKPIAVWLQSTWGVSAVNPLVVFYDIHGRKREVLFFYFVPDTTRDLYKILK